MDLEARTLPDTTNEMKAGTAPGFQGSDRTECKLHAASNASQCRRERREQRVSVTPSLDRGFLSRTRNFSPDPSSHLGQFLLCLLDVSVRV